MRRHGKEALRKNPDARRQDEEATRRACAKFALVPTSVMNFPEGTRFSEAKRKGQSSPYAHLLKPKAGALALTLNAMGAQFNAMIDATIVYPDGIPTFWDFLCGRVPRVVVRVRQLPIPADFPTSNYAADSAFRRRFHDWLGQVWQEKDRQIAEVLNAPAESGR
jgi:1-acyl-sn-glycerol-3-phosphate acyltransferase